MHEVSREFLIFHQDSAPAHRARDTVQLLEQEMPAFIFPQINGHWTTTISTQFITRSGLSSSSVSASHGFTVSMRWTSVCCTFGIASHHWQCNLRMARASSSLRAVQAMTLWAAVVTVFITLEQERFKTNVELCVSQGSVATYLRNGWKSCTHFCWSFNSLFNSERMFLFG